MIVHSRIVANVMKDTLCLGFPSHLTPSKIELFGKNDVAEETSFVFDDKHIEAIRVEFGELKDEMKQYFFQNVL